MACMKTKLYTSAQAAQLLSLSESRICQVCRWNSIGTKIGRDWVLTAAEVAKLSDLENRRKRTA